MASIIWRPLDTARKEIRLASLSPCADVDAVLECTLQNVSTLADIEYDAISYVWGDANDTVDMILEHQIYPITRNLDSCLRNMRNQHVVRLLWIDAIRINQKDKNEKAKQIVLMRDIYQMAQRVCVFLGENSPKMSLAFQIVESIVSHKRLREVWIGNERLAPADLLCLDALGASEWWERVWVVQEALLNDNVVFHSGTRTITMSTFRMFAVTWREIMSSWSKDTQQFFSQDEDDLPPSLLSSIATPINNLLNVSISYARTRILEYGDDKDHFLRILGRCRERKTSYQQDKVYGLLGLSSRSFLDSFSSCLDLEPAQAFRKFGEAYLYHTQRLSLFNQCSFEERSALELPSWVPDWSQGNRAMQYNVDRLDFQHFYQAGSRRPLNFHLLEEFVLCLEGIHIDMIEKVGAMNTLYDDDTGQNVYTNQAAVFKNWESTLGLESFSRQGSRYVTGGALIEAYWRTLFGDLMLPQNGFAAETRRCKTSDLIEYSKWITAVKAGPPAQPPRAAQSSVLQATANRRLIVCSKGYIGLAPAEAKRGDHVYVLVGGRVPYVLRSLEHNATGQRRFKIVGECYLHGIMDGEALEFNPRSKMGLRDSFRMKVYKTSAPPDGTLGESNLRPVFLE